MVSLTLDFLFSRSVRGLLDRVGSWSNIDVFLMILDGFLITSR